MGTARALVMRLGTGCWGGRSAVDVADDLAAVVLFYIHALCIATILRRTCLRMGWTGRAPALQASMPVGQSAEGTTPWHTNLTPQSSPLVSIPARIHCTSLASMHEERSCCARR